MFHYSVFLFFIQFFFNTNDATDIHRVFFIQKNIDRSKVNVCAMHENMLLCMCACLYVVLQNVGVCACLYEWFAKCEYMCVFGSGYEDTRMLFWHSEFDSVAVNGTFGTSTMVNMLTRQTNSAVYRHHHLIRENDTTDLFD